LSTLHGDRDKLILYDGSPTHKHDILDLPNVTSFMIPPGHDFLPPASRRYNPFANYKASASRECRSSRRSYYRHAGCPSRIILRYHRYVCLRISKSLQESFETPSRTQVSCLLIPTDHLGAIREKSPPPRTFALSARFENDPKSKCVFLELALAQPSRSAIEPDCGFV